MESKHIHVVATVSSKGQVTIPKEVREALGIGSGDRLSMVLAGDEIKVSKPISPEELAGSLPPPEHLRGKDFSEIRAAARAARYGGWRP